MIHLNCWINELEHNNISYNSFKYHRSLLNRRRVSQRPKRFSSGSRCQNFTYDLGSHGFEHLKKEVILKFLKDDGFNLSTAPTKSVFDTAMINKSFIEITLTVDDF